VPFFGGRRQGNDQIAPNPAQIRRASETEAGGVAFLREGSLAKAESTLRRSLAGNPRSATAHGYLALTLYRLGRYVEASAESRDAVNLSPTDDMLQRTHGMIFEALGRLDEAAIAYGKAIELKPDSPQSHAALGALSLKRGDIQGAENLLATALCLDPEDTKVIEDMAEVRRRQGKPDLAVSILGAALLTQPAHPALNLKLGRLLAEMGQTATAIQAFQSALNQRPHDADILSALGAALLQTGRHDDVRRLYDQAMKALPGNKQRYEADFRSLLMEYMASQPAEEDLPVPVSSRVTPSGRLILDAMPAIIAPVHTEPAHDSKSDRASAAAPDHSMAPADAPVLTLVTAPSRTAPENPGADQAPRRTPRAKKETTASLVESPLIATNPAPEISALEAKVKGDPSNSRLYRELSILYLRAGRLSDAMEMGRKAEQLRAGARQLERAGWS
jgi:Flp pilus assembly protein TadD